MSQPPKMQIRSENAVYWMGGLASLSVFVMGYAHVFLSQLAATIQHKNGFEADQLALTLTLAVSATSLGESIGPVMYNYMANRFGQAQAFVRCHLGVILATSLQLISLQWTFLIVGRLLMGLVIGVMISLLPLYLNSISPLAITGKIGSLNQLMTCVGVIFAYVLGFFVREDGKDEIVWRVLVGFPIVPCLISVVTFTWIFPYDRIQRHLQTGQTTKLTKYIGTVYQNASISDLFDQKMRIHGNTSHQTYHRQSQRYIIAVLMSASVQGCGINGIFYFAKQLFQDITGGEVLLSQQLMLGLSVCQVASCLFAGKFIDQFGRKYLLLRGQATLVAILLGIFIVDNLQEYIHPKLVHYAIIALIYAHIVVFNFSLGPVCIIYAAQLVPNMVPVIVSLRIATLMVALSTNYIIHQYGIGQLFLVFGVASMVIYYYLKDHILETKGMSKPDIYQMFEEPHQAQSQEQKMALALV